ncbi:MAG: hypothetical protein QXE67_03230 [Nitrososphaerota archaeon]|nr:hypothetical protein [Candidatus Geocrenenecus dongiae]
MNKNKSLSGIVEVWSEFDVELSLNASFILPFFDKFGDEYVKYYGRRRGLRIRQEKNLLKFEGGYDFEVIMFSGAWFNPHLEIRKTSRNVRSILDRLLEIFPGLGLAIDPWDKIAVLYTIFLSRNTDYHNNTVRWMKKILKMAEDEEKIKSVKLDEVGKSYQLNQLKIISDKITSIFSLEEFSREVHGLEEFLNLRKKILSIKYCGPKVAHGWGLFSLGLTCLSQVDRHLLNIGSSLGIIGPDDKNPVKSLCITSRCFLDKDCRILRKCITYKLYNLFGHMAGWFQTAIYLYGSFYLDKYRDPLRLMKK